MEKLQNIKKSKREKVMWMAGDVMKEEKEQSGRICRKIKGQQYIAALAV